MYTSILKLHIPKADVKLPREDPVGIIRVMRKHGRQLRGADKRNAELETLLAGYTMKCELAAERGAVAECGVAPAKIEAEKTLMYYDNTYTPSSNDTITQREINAEKKVGRKKNPAGRRGKKRHKNMAISRKGRAARPRKVPQVRQQKPQCNRRGK